MNPSFPKRRQTHTSQPPLQVPDLMPATRCSAQDSHANVARASMVGRRVVLCLIQALALPESAVCRRVEFAICNKVDSVICSKVKSAVCHKAASRFAVRTPAWYLLLCGTDSPASSAQCYHPLQSQPPLSALPTGARCCSGDNVPRSGGWTVVTLRLSQPPTPGPFFKISRDILPGKKGCFSGLSIS